TGPPVGPATRRPWAGGLVAIALVLAVAGAAALAPDGGPPIGRLSVAAVQGGGRRGVSKAQVRPAAVFAAQIDATHRMTRRHGGRAPALVLWPEDVVSVDGRLAGTPEAAMLSSLARRLRTTVVAGVTVTVPDLRFLNEAVAWGPAGHVAGAYEKVHRVPFGEYIPDRPFFAHFANLSAVPRDAVPGHGSGLLPTPAAPLGVMVSYEVFFAGRGRSAVRAGAHLLVVPTNTSSYTTSQVPSQEVAADRVQAVEEGRDLVQAAPTGYSTVVRSDGTVAHRSGLGDRQVLLATVALRAGPTPYERWGDPPVLALCVLLLASGILGARAARGRAHGRRPNRGRGRAQRS
ncbi:MAG: apolipoprotein N-acyltransferase, partial [Acidimicrobiales bacterium]